MIQSLQKSLKNISHVIDTLNDLFHRIRIKRDVILQFDKNINGPFLFFKRKWYLGIGGFAWPNRIVPIWCRVIWPGLILHMDHRDPVMVFYNYIVWMFPCCTEIVTHIQIESVGR